ncbi:MAG: hypothetical protein JST21_14540 [Bacteroidetes bacterium]|nr:hypothetical protein [Bacteroidota bacterium]MBS1747383.1 hypothetical protein [Bacteroidota bacterium]
MTILVATVSLQFRPFANSVYISGHLKGNPTDTSLHITELSVFVKSDKKVLAKAFVNYKGDFELTFSTDKKKSFDFYCYGTSVDTFLMASVRTFDNDNPEMTFLIPNIYSTNKSGEIICPKCKKGDKTCKISYSEQICIVGDTSYSTMINGKRKIGHNYLQIAKYSCDRDEINF